MATNEARISALLEQINQSAISLKHGDDRVRDDIVEACQSLIREVERPSDTFSRFALGYMPALMALRTGIDLKLYQQLSDEPKDNIELSKPTSADPGLVLRVLRVLSAAGIVRPVGKDSFCATDFSTAMARDDFANGLLWQLDANGPALLSTPAYLRERDWQNPVDPKESPLSVNYPSTNGEKEVAFQIWSRIGLENGLFSFLKAWKANTVFWADEKHGFYPFTERLLNGSSDDAALLVDMGGGSGADLHKLIDLHPSAARLVLQDLPTVIEDLQTAESPSQIQLMSHDFFTPQPIIGARAYFLHSVLHDWPIHLAKQILCNTAAAMRKGFSKLIIYDSVLPDVDCPLAMAGLDWCIMTYLSAGERTESAWRELIESDDVQPKLKVTGVWSYSRNHQAVIEAELEE